MNMFLPLAQAFAHGLARPRCKEEASRTHDLCRHDTCTGLSGWKKMSYQIVDIALHQIYTLLSGDLLQSDCRFQ